MHKQAAYYEKKTGPLRPEQVPCLSCIIYSM